MTYTGERGSVSGALDLRAEAITQNARIVGVTFRLDGKPLISSTVSPYSRSLDPRFLPAGRHSISVVAVDSLGRRVHAKPVRVSLAPGKRGGPVVSPKRGLAAGLAALARGGTVRFLPGRYVLTDVRLGSGAQLIGSGKGTVLAAPGGASYRSILIASGRQIRVSDLTLDGGGQGPGTGTAVEVVTGSSDVLLRRLQIVHVRRVGLFAWGAYSQVSLQDSLLDGDGTADAGFIAGESGNYGASSDSSMIRTTVRRFKNWGVLFAHLAHGAQKGALHAVALDNVVTDIRGSSRPPGTAEGGIWSGSVEGAIIGNTVLRAGWDGIETVGSSSRATVIGNRVGATRTGIYLEHATNDSIIARNRIWGIESGITVEWSYGGIASTRNTFLSNRIVGATRGGMHVSIGADWNRISDNVFVGGARPMILLQGSSDNVVRGNRSCGAKGVLVAEEVGPDENGSPMVPKRNVITANLHAASCADR